MGKNKKRKGFTLVELLVVIAILAVLATVAILGYTSFTKKANIANDQAICSQMNMILQANESLDEKARYAHEAVEQCIANGFILENLTPSTAKYNFAYDQQHNRFMLLDDEFKFNFGDVNHTEVKKENNYWIYVVVGTDKELKDVNNEGFSTYLRNDFMFADEKNAIETSKGIDVGACENVLRIEYFNEENDQHVIFHTNGGALTINDKTEGTIKHYGTAIYLQIVECATASYHEFGIVDMAEINTGRIVNENAFVEVVNKDGETEIVDAGVKILYVNSINEYSTTENTEFDEIIVSAADGATLPEFRRGKVNIADEGTLVVKVEVVENESVTDEDYIWLFKNGVLSQMVVVDEEIAGIKAVTNDQGKVVKFVATDNEGKVVSLGVKEETNANKKASAELANYYNGSKVDYTVNGVNAPELTKDGEIVLDKNETIEIVVKDSHNEQTLQKEQASKAAEGYVAMNSTTKKYYKDAELAFNEAEAYVDTIVILADTRICLDNIPVEINFDLNGKTLQTYNHYQEKVPATCREDANYVDVRLFGYDELYDCDWNPMPSTFAQKNVKYIAHYSYDDKYYYVTPGGDTSWFGYVSTYNSYYFSGYKTVEKDNRTVLNVFDGNSTALKYFDAGFGTKARPFEIVESKHFENINSLGLGFKTYYKLMNDLVLESSAYAIDDDYDFDLNGKMLEPHRHAAFWAVDYLRVHNGKVVLTADNGSLFGDDSYTSTIYIEDINLYGNVSAPTATQYGALTKYLGNSNNNNSQTSTCYVKNLNSYVNIKAEGASVGGLFGYCLNSAISLENVNVYGSIETGNTAGGIVMGDSQVCGYSDIEAHQYIKVENVKFYGSILVPEGKSAYIYGQTKPKNTTDADFKGEGATIVKGINIDKDIIIAENNEFKINAKSAYTKYVVKLTFNIDYADGKAGGYPRMIEREFVITSDELISTGLYKNAILTTDNIEGMTLISDDYNSIYVKDGVDDDMYYFLTYGTYKLSNNNVTVKVYAYTGENLKAIGTYSYTYNLGE